MNGAYCDKDGKIYLRVVSWGDNWKLKVVDHAVSIEEAQCVAMELLGAVHRACWKATGRDAVPEGSEGKGTGHGWHE